MKLLMILTLSLLGFAARAQTLEEQILAIKGHYDETTSSILDEIVSALNTKEPVWLKVVGEANQIPSLALEPVPQFSFIGSRLQINNLAATRREMASGLAHRDARHSFELDILKVFWRFQTPDGKSLLIHAPLLEPVIHLFLSPRKPLPANTESIFKGEFLRITGIMRTIQSDLSQIRVTLEYERPPISLIGALTEITGKIGIAQTLMDLEPVRTALGRLALPIDLALGASQSFSGRMAEYAERRFPVINNITAFPEIPSDVPVNYLCFGPFTEGGRIKPN